MKMIGTSTPSCTCTKLPPTPVVLASQYTTSSPSSLTIPKAPDAATASFTFNQASSQLSFQAILTLDDFVVLG
jgi:hypothetical protein